MGGYRGGTSERQGMPAVRTWMRDLSGKIHTVVDFGIGQGYLGEQARRYVRPRRVVGCDVYQPVVDRARGGEIYDEVYSLSLLDFVNDPRCPQGRGVLWMFGDVLEHVPQDRALHLLQHAKAEYVLLRIPVGPYPQKGNKHNPAEEHLWTFYPDMLQAELVQHAYITPLVDRHELCSFTTLERQRVYERPKAYLGNFLLTGFLP